MYTIETGDLTMHLEVVRVETLQEHEETLPHVADTLALEFRNWAHLQNPIIVEHHHIVLDGNHRTFVFKQLGFRFIPVCRIDYYSEHVGLRYWFRVIRGTAAPLEHIIRIVSGMGGRMERVGSREILATELVRHPLACGLETGSVSSLVRFPSSAAHDAVSAYHALERLQERILQAGGELEYVPCRDLTGEGACTLPGENDLAIWTPHITKDMVVGAAREGKVFTPKATRHLVPARPIHVDVPVRWFRENVSEDEMNARFAAFLRNKEIRRFGPGQVINGRYYGEEVFVFYDRKGPGTDRT
jgi:L-serine kinase (ADP)